jgi:hypothetical protein
MPGLDRLSETFVLPWWAALAVALLVAALAVFAGLRNEWPKTVGSLAQFVVVAGLLFAAWIFFDRMAARDVAEERRAYQARLADLNSRALAPSSPLSCLDALAGDALDEACEKAIFANPETVAAAVSLTAARVRLLREGIARAAAGGDSYDRAVVDLRRSLEQDRFGFVARALAAGEQCVPESCEALSLFKDADRIAANLKDHTFEIFIGRHVAAWRSRPGGPTVASTSGQPTAPAGGIPAAQAAVAPASSSVVVDFPSASSIPPVSIMKNEPGMTGQGGTEADPKATDSKPAAPRRAASTPAPPPRAASRSGNAAPSTAAQ